MKIIYNTSIFQKYFESISEKFRRGNSDITEIVIHGTGGGESAQAILKWMEDGERAEEYKKGISLFHSEIDRDGVIYNIIPFNFWCYHSSSGQHDKQTVGLELINTYPLNKGIYIYEQYNTLIELINYIKTICPIKTIVGHGYNGRTYSNKDKECPGMYFEWHQLIKNLNLKQIAKDAYEVL